MKFTIFTANCTGDAGNCSYPNMVIVDNPETLKAAVTRDHVCAAYKDNYRANANFLQSDCIVMDIDNDHTDHPQDYITPEKMDELFADVDYVLVPSRHHMKPKGAHPAAPRYHVFFPTDTITSGDVYARLKAALQAQHTFFDNNALDAARFLYGCKVDEVIWHEGWLSVTDCIEDVDTEADPAEESKSSRAIPEGSRNNTMSRFAGRVLKRYGLTEKARGVFDEHALKCDPPLPQQELDTIWNSACKFYKTKVMTVEGYVPPEEYNDEFGAASLKPEDYSDLGEAKVLAREFGEELKYTSATDLLRYDGECWREDKQMSLGASLDFADLQLADARDAVKTAEDAIIKKGVDENTVKSRGKHLIDTCDELNIMPLLYMLLGADTYLKFVMKYRNYRNIINVQNTVKPMVAIDVADLDADPNLLNTPYATYDLSKGLMGEKPHDPADLITKITACAPGAAGKDIWEKALETFFCGDQELIDYVQREVGTAAVGKVYEEHLIIAYGGGANGKSTFWNTIFRVLGTYAGKISADTLTMNCKHNSRPEAAELKGKRLIIASEMEEGMRLNTSMVKQLCSTDEIQAEKKYKDPFHFVPSHTLVLYTNHLPKVGANDDGIWRRLVVIPFNAKITGKSDIKNYADYLYENAGEYIMTWMIEGAKKAIDDGFHAKVPKVVQEAIDAYRDTNNWLGHFMDDCCDVGDGLSEKSGDLYQGYRAYALQCGEYVRSTTDFYSALEKAGYERHRTKKGVTVYGLRLREGQDFLL